MPTTGPTAKTYPTEEQYEDWKDEADEFDMSVSEYIASMVEAGRKKFEPTTEADEEAAELRRQRNDLKRELEHARERNSRLEDRLHHGERAVIERYVSENPGATWAEIVQEVGDELPERVTDHLDTMEGQSLTRDGDGYYPLGGSE